MADVREWMIALVDFRSNDRIRYIQFKDEMKKCDAIWFISLRDPDPLSLRSRSTDPLRVGQPCCIIIEACSI